MLCGSGHHQSDLTRRGRAVRSRMQPARAPITGQRRRRVLDRPGTYTADRHDLGVTASPARSSRSVPGSARAQGGIITRVAAKV